MRQKKPPLYTLKKDSKITGLFVRTTAAGVRAYVFDRRLKNGESRRVTIGRVGEWKLKAARERAQELAVEFSKGIDPRIQAKQDADSAAAVRLEEQRKDLVLEGVWRLYIEDRTSAWDSKKDKPAWGDRHRKMHTLLASPGGEKKKRGKGLTKPGPLASLMPFKLADITSDVVESWLKIEVRKRATNAHQSYRLLKAFTVWAHDYKKDGVRPYRGVIPADACTAKEVLKLVPSNKVKKNDVLQKQQLPAWFDAVRSGGNATIAAYLQILLLTGARRNELATLKRADINFSAQTLLLRDKVEGERTIPLTPYVSQLLDALPKPTKAKCKQWAFWSADSASGRVMEQRIAHNRALKVAALPHVSLHGLRRSFRTLSEWLEIPVGIIAQIQGHKPSATVEKHYVDRPIDLLRVHHTRLEAWILEQGAVTWAPLESGATEARNAAE